MESGGVFPAGARDGEDTARLTAEEVERRLAARAQAQPAHICGGDTRRGDDDLNPGMLDRSGALGALQEAAVLVPLVCRPAGPQILLTRRTSHLSDHAGQIAFPGGRIEAWDASPESAALREAEEEVGLTPEAVRLLGRLDTYVTRTGYRVTPVVAMTDPQALTPNAYEVAEVFEVPLAFILDPAAREVHARRHDGRERYYYVFPYRDYYIWGATAGMLVNLAEVLDGQW